jgi:hypothetical protein
MLKAELVFVCKRFRGSGIDSKESITTACFVIPARQAGNRFLGSLKGLQIRAQTDHLDQLIGETGF